MRWILILVVLENATQFLLKFQTWPVMRNLLNTVNKRCLSIFYPHTANQSYSSSLLSLSVDLARKLHVCFWFGFRRTFFVTSLRTFTLRWRDCSFWGLLCFESDNFSNKLGSDIEFLSELLFSSALASVSRNICIVDGLRVGKLLFTLFSAALKQSVSF